MSYFIHITIIWQACLKALMTNAVWFVTCHIISDFFEKLLMTAHIHLLDVISLFLMSDPMQDIVTAACYNKP